MVYRFSWLAGIAGGLLALLRLERLLRSSVEGLPWEIILVAAAVLGGAITWAALAYRLSAAAVVLANAAALLLTVTRVAVPATTWFVFPTLSSFRSLGTELNYALDVIRTGVAPVPALAGVIAILTAIFWVLGGLLTWGLRRDRPYVAVLAPLVVYLQFATMDRRRSGPWTLAFLLLFGLSLLAVAADRRGRGTGLLTAGPGRAAVARSRPSLAVGAVAVLMLLTAFSSNALATLLPRSGLLDWRAASLLGGDYYGSISYNPFVGIRQSLVSPTGTPLFLVEVSGEVRPEQVYFRLLTLDSFNGTQWHLAEGTEVRMPEESPAFEDPGAAFHGPTRAVTQHVVMLALEQDWLPAAYSPTGLASPIRAVARGFRVRPDDASLYFGIDTFTGMEYTVESRVPYPDLAVLSLGSDGLPSPVFAAASAAEEGYEAVPAPEPPPTYELPNEERYLDLPEGLPAGMAALARSQVAGLATPFEKALALEDFFRRPGAFRYSADIEPGHEASDLGAWLLDPQSPNYRTGYCEQFATAMAVLARQVGLPSRVVLGFTPGTLTEEGAVVIRDRNAHAWVELWMPTQGWVRFDPTPRGDEVNPATSDDLPFDVAAYLDVDTTTPTFAPGTNPPQTLPTDDDLPPIPPLPPVGGGGWAVAVPGWAVFTVLGGLLAFGLIPALKWLRRARRLRALSTGDVSAAWWEIVDRLTDLGEEPSAAATPAEVAAATDTAMAPLARAYGESVYGPPAGRVFDLGRVVTATRSLEETEGRLAGRYSWLQRLASWYRLRSLTPRRWRLRKR